MRNEHRLWALVAFNLTIPKASAYNGMLHRICSHLASINKEDASDSWLLPFLEESAERTG